MNKEHTYNTLITWTGNTGKGTSGYASYDRAHEVSVGLRTPILCSSDPQFRGDANRYNPEELLVASLSSCHMLWYLHLCAENNIVVLEYEDRAMGIMTENEDGSGQFSRVTLRPRVVISETSHILEAERLHDKANSLCFIARSCNFEVVHEAICLRKK